MSRQTRLNIQSMFLNWMGTLRQKKNNLCFAYRMFKKLLLLNWKWESKGISPQIGSKVNEETAQQLDEKYTRNGDLNKSHVNVSG